ncbi:GFA family protein [Candidatus Poribacteria bacterium]|nr:GFA family protein [Candidatus Poribacteria bacterium]
MTSLTLRGSCLCGSVQYEISGEPAKFYHCHCQRCRKATGTGHASNLLVKPGAIKWLKGEELIKAYKVPEAKRFTSRFCSKCGSQVPRYVKETDFIVIPAGSLDSAPTIQPQARIFWDSRADWSCSGDDLPTYSEYPT